MASELEKLRKSLSADSKKRAKQTFQSQQRTISSTGSAGNTPIDKNKLGQNLERQKRKEERLENVRAFLEDWGDTGKGKKTTTNNIAGSIPGYTPMTDRQADVIRDRRKQFTKESGLATLRSGLADIETSLALSGGKDEFLKRKAEEYRRQLEPLERHVDQYSEQLKKQKWVDELEEQYNNNFRGRSLASINSGRIQLEKGRAANEFGAVPTEENEEYRQFMNAVEALYNQNNMDLLDEGKILSNSFASYLPQLGNQIVNTAPYTLVGGALGGVGTVITGNPQFIKKGVQIGSAIGSGITSYNDIRGAVINDLLNLGIDRETAIAAAHDEAVLSGIVEMAETAMDLSPKLGILGGAIDSVTNVITKAGTKVIPNAVLRKVAVALGKYGINISSEALEEGLQEVISIANQNRITGDAETGYSISDTGVGNLLKATANQVFDLSAEEKAQVLGSAKEGAKIAAIMGGINTGIAHTTNRVTTTAEQIRLGRERNESGTVEDMIQEGLAKKEDSQAYKIAKKLQAKSEAGENITSREIGQLYKANEVAFKKAEELVDETEEQAKERKSMTQEILDSYGKVGKETLEKFRDANIDLYDFHKEFSKFYQGGLVNEDLDKLTKRYGEKLPSQVREAAHIAGTRDAELSLKEDVKNATPEVYANTKGGIEANEHATKVDKKTYAKVDGIAKLFGTQVRFLPKVYTYDSNGKVTGKANGNYNGKVLEVSLDAENPVMVVITHELTHHLKRIAPAEYRIFRDAAVRYSLMQGGDSTTVVEQYRRVYSGRGVNINQEGAMDEIAADTAMLYALDENKDILEEIATTLEERNAFQKIIDSIKEFLQKIKNYLKSDKSLKKTLEANEIEKQVSEMERIVDLWKDALRAAKSNLENAEKTTTAQPKESKPLNSLKSQKPLTKDALEVDIKKNTTDAHNLPEREIRKDGYKAIGHGDASTDSKSQQKQDVKQFSLKQEAAKENAIKALNDIEDISATESLNDDWSSVESNTLAVGFKSDLINKGGTSLVGKTIKSPSDLAVLAQVFRDPRFETFRYFFVDEKGKIVYHTGVSTRLPSASHFAVGEANEYINSIAYKASEAGAVGLYILHNHPSGDPTPSNSDVMVTGGIANTFNEHMPIKFKGHVVINSNKYSFVDNQLNIHTLNLNIGEDKLLKPAFGGEYIGQDIANAESLAKFAKKLQISKDCSVLIFTDAKLKTKAIQEIHNASLTDSKILEAYLKRQTVAFGSPYVFLCVDNEETLEGKSVKQLIADNYFLDVVIISTSQKGGENIKRTDRDPYLEDAQAIERWSLKGTSNILKENARLKEYNDYLKEQIEISSGKRSAKPINTIVDQIVKDYKGELDKEVLQTQLEELYEYAKKPSADWQIIKEKAISVATDMVSDSVIADRKLLADIQMFRDTIRKSKIAVDDAAKADFKGDYNEFRKRNFGWLKTSEEGKPVGEVYAELADLFPEYLDSEITDSVAQLRAMEEMYSTLKGVEISPYSNDTEIAIEYLSNDLIARLFGIEGEKLRQDSKKRLDDAVKTERAKNEAKLKKYKEKQAESRKKMSEKRKRKIMREKILRHIKPMQKKLLSPTDKQHVPEELRTSVARVLACIDTSSNRLNAKGEETKRTKAFADAKEQLLAIAGETNLDPALFGGGDNKNNFEDLFNTLSEKKLDDMSIEELKTAWEVVKAMETAIQNYNKTLAKARYATIDGWADAFDKSVSERKTKSQNKPNELSLDMQTPITFFNNFGQAGRDFFKMLRDAQDYESSILAELADKVADVVSRKQRKKFEKEQHTFKLESDESITLSTAHIMELYVGVRREAFARHLYEGGMHQPEVGKVARGTETLTITKADTTKMFKKLTQEEKEIADKMQKLTLFLAEKGNNASMKAYGYEKFTDPNYWTIDSAKEGIPRSVDKNTKEHPRSIANMGSANPLKDDAKTPLEIKGMFKTFDQHTVDMSTYAAWLLPMEDANRLFKYRFKTQDASGKWIPIKNKEIVKMINKYAGRGGDDYWINLMTDIQNGLGKTSDTATGKLIAKGINNVKKASVAGNLRVVAQQPMAYLRAFAVLDLRDMEIATAKFKATPGKGWEKALKYAPIATRKAMGGFDISTSTLEDYLYVDKKKSGKDKVPFKDKPMWLASKADEITWGWIWNACEANIQRTQKSLEVGSEEFYDVVAEKFADVINQTQVVDGVLQRSQIMRSGSENVQAVSMFMGEPIMSLNLVYRVYDMLRYATGKERSGVFKKLGKATMALLASNVAVAVAQSLPDAARDDESDEDYFRRFLEALTGITGKEETWWELAKNIAIGGNLGNSLNVLSWHPLMNEFMSLYQGFTSERLDAQTVGNLISSTKELYKAFTGDSKMTIAQATRKTVETGAKLLGSSMANVTRDIESILRSVLTGTDNWYAHYNVEKLKYKVSESPNHFIDIAYLALKHENYADYEAIRADMIANGVSEKKIDARLKNKSVTDEKLGKEAYDNLVAELEREGLLALDKEVQDEILRDAEAYVASTQLSRLSRDSYTEEYSWITEAQNSKANLGISTAEFLMLKQEYSSKTLKSNEIKQAHMDGVIDAETYLEYNMAFNSTKSDDKGKKQDKLKSHLKNSGLTNEEQLYIWKNVFGYKSWY